MTRPLLETKFHAPSAEDAVARPRLSERMRTGATATLTLVSAPAGFGKSTLMAELARSSVGVSMAGTSTAAASAAGDPPVAWLSLDPGDIEPAPALVVTTSGALGGWMQPGGPFSAAPLPAPMEDTYGAGDSFAAGLTFALAQGLDPQDAVGFAARCGAAALTGRGVSPQRVELPADDADS